MAILLGALALLLVLGGVIIHFSFSQTPTTSGAPKNLSSTSVQNQKVKDYQKLYLQATSGSPVIDDPLNAPNSLGWLVDEKCHFSGGALHLQSGPVVCSATNFEASDFAYQVQVTINAGKRVGNSVPGAGIVFRFNPIGTYYLEVGADGSCELGALKTSPGKTPLVLLHTCPALHTGYHQKNLLTAIMRGPDIYVYINKQFVGTSSDGTYGSGLVGVFAVGTASDAAFQNAQIWNLR